jgi:transposase
MGKAYTRQFREQAMKLVTEQGYTAGRAARELGIPDNTLESWLKKVGWKRRPIVEAPLSEDPKVLAIQVRELRKAVKRLEMEKEILKKATAFFANPHLNEPLNGSGSSSDT